MSGKPSRDGVTTFREALQKLAYSDQQIARLRLEIADRQKDLAAFLPAAESARREVFELMKGMDVQHSHNFGYENRMEWFLVELHRQFTNRGESSLPEPEEAKT